MTLSHKKHINILIIISRRLKKCIIVCQWCNQTLHSMQSIPARKQSPLYISLDACFSRSLIGSIWFLRVSIEAAYDLTCSIISSLCSWKCANCSFNMFSDSWQFSIHRINRSVDKQNKKPDLGAYRLEDRRHMSSIFQVRSRADTQ